MAEDVVDLSIARRYVCAVVQMSVSCSCGADTDVPFLEPQLSHYQTRVECAR